MHQHAQETEVCLSCSTYKWPLGLLMGVVAFNPFCCLQLLARHPKCRMSFRDISQDRWEQPL